MKQPDMTARARQPSRFGDMFNWGSEHQEAQKREADMLKRMGTFKPIRRQKKVNFSVGGAKTIGTVGAYVYLVNQIFAEGLATLPYVTLEAGWLPTLLSNIVLCLMSTFVALMTMRSMTMIEGNQNFEKRYEYVPTAQHFLGERIGVILEYFYHALQLFNLLSVGIVASRVDLLLSQIFGFTCGIELYPQPSFRWFAAADPIYLHDTGGDGQLSIRFVISLGYLLTAGLSIFLARYNLEESSALQIVSIAVNLFTVGALLCAAIARIVWPPFVVFVPPDLSAMSLPCHLWIDLPSSGTCSRYPELFLDTLQRCPPLWNLSGCVTSSVGGSSAPVLRRRAVRPPSTLGHHKFQMLFGVFANAYSYTNVIPSWANEVQAHVEIPRTLWLSSAFSCAAYSIFGFLIAFAFPDITEQNSFAELVAADSVHWMVRLAIHLFELSTLANGVVVNLIASRYNMENTGVFDARAAFFVGCVSPFLVIWTLGGTGIGVEGPPSILSNIIDWLSLALSIGGNYVVPAFVYIVACKNSPLAFRDDVRHNTLRMGIEAFAPQRGSVFEVQAALREWAATMVDQTPELKALLELNEQNQSQLSEEDQESQEAPRRRSLGAGLEPSGSRLEVEDELVEDNIVEARHRTVNVVGRKGRGRSVIGMSQLRHKFDSDDDDDDEADASPQDSAGHVMSQQTRDAFDLTAVSQASKEAMLRAEAGGADSGQLDRAPSAEMPEKSPVVAFSEVFEGNSVPSFEDKKGSDQLARRVRCQPAPPVGSSMSDVSPSEEVSDVSDLSSVLGNQLQWRFTVVDIVNSYKHEDGEEEEDGDTDGNRTDRSAWEDLIRDYKSRLNRGELDYSQSDSQDDQTSVSGSVAMGEAARKLSVSPTTSGRPSQARLNVPTRSSRRSFTEGRRRRSTAMGNLEPFDQLPTGRRHSAYALAAEGGANPADPPAFSRQKRRSATISARKVASRKAVAQAAGEDPGPDPVAFKLDLPSYSYAEKTSGDLMHADSDASGRSVLHLSSLNAQKIEDVIWLASESETAGESSGQGSLSKRQPPEIDTTAHAVDHASTRILAPQWPQDVEAAPQFVRPDRRGRATREPEASPTESAEVEAAPQFVRPDRRGRATREPEASPTERAEVGEWKRKAVGQCGLSLADEQHFGEGATVDHARTGAFARTGSAGAGASAQSAPQRLASEPLTDSRGRRKPPLRGRSSEAGQGGRAMCFRSAQSSPSGSRTLGAAMSAERKKPQTRRQMEVTRRSPNKEINQISRESGSEGSMKILLGLRGSSLGTVDIPSVRPPSPAAADSNERAVLDAMNAKGAAKRITSLRQWEEQSPIASISTTASLLGSGSCRSALRNFVAQGLPPTVSEERDVAGEVGKAWTQSDAATVQVAHVTASCSLPGNVGGALAIGSGDSSKSTIDAEPPVMVAFTSAAESPRASGTGYSQAAAVGPSSADGEDHSGSRQREMMLGETQKSTRGEERRLRQFVEKLRLREGIKLSARSPLDRRKAAEQLRRVRAVRQTTTASSHHSSAATRAALLRSPASKANSTTSVIPSADESSDRCARRKPRLRSSPFTSVAEGTKAPANLLTGTPRQDDSSATPAEVTTDLRRLVEESSSSPPTLSVNDDGGGDALPNFGGEVRTSSLSEMFAQSESLLVRSPQESFNARTSAQTSEPANKFSSDGKGACSPRKAQKQQGQPSLETTTAPTEENSGGLGSQSSGLAGLATGSVTHRPTENGGFRTDSFIPAPLSKPSKCFSMDERGFRRFGSSRRGAGRDFAHSRQRGERRAMRDSPRHSLVNAVKRETNTDERDRVWKELMAFSRKLSKMIDGKGELADFSEIGPPLETVRMASRNRTVSTGGEDFSMCQSQLDGAKALVEAGRRLACWRSSNLGRPSCEDEVMTLRSLSSSLERMLSDSQESQKSKESLQLGTLAVARAWSGSRIETIPETGDGDSEENEGGAGESQLEIGRGLKTVSSSSRRKGAFGRGSTNSSGCIRRLFDSKSRQTGQFGRLASSETDESAVFDGRLGAEQSSLSSAGSSSREENLRGDTEGGTSPFHIELPDREILENEGLPMALRLDIFRESARSARDERKMSAGLQDMSTDEPIATEDPPPTPSRGERKHSGRTLAPSPPVYPRRRAGVRPAVRLREPSDLVAQRGPQEERDTAWSENSSPPPRVAIRRASTGKTEDEDDEVRYACDEDPDTGKKRPIRIPVYPVGIMRRNHLVTTYGVVGMLLVFGVSSVVWELILILKGEDH